MDNLQELITLDNQFIYLPQEKKFIIPKHIVDIRFYHHHGLLHAVARISDITKGSIEEIEISDCECVDKLRDLCSVRSGFSNDAFWGILPSNDDD